MEKYTFNFEKLDVWQKSRLLVNQIYMLTKDFPKEEIFALTSQLRRAVVSIVSNLAEGNSRSSLKEQCRFTEIAYDSLTEVYCQLMIAKDLNYINNDSFELLQPYNLRNIK